MIDFRILIIIIVVLLLVFSRIINGYIFRLNEIVKHLTAISINTKSVSEELKELNRKADSRRIQQVEVES